jgi:protein kinase C substrate 80K-H
VSLASGEEVTATIPPDAIRQAGEAFCDEQAALVVTMNAESCASGPQLSAADMPLPASIPDGFLGYTAPKPREPVSNNALAEALVAWDLLLPEGNDAAEADQERSQLEENIEAKRQLGSEQKEIEDEIQSLLDSVGLEDKTKFGPDGELYAFKDECYSHDTGKYVYEICLFGSAKQKEGKGAAGGTNLGEWTGTEVDEETGQRLWRWLNGQRCWNGPSRSATAYITCGANTRVVSVEEPEMCKYELQVESYIACDEAFRTANSLDAE